MTVKELRSVIIRCLESAQKASTASDQSNPLRAYEDSIRVERDRVRLFVAALAGSVQDDDPKLSEALNAFLDGKPGEPLDAKK